MPLDPDLLHLVKLVSTRGTKVSIFDDSGRLLWYSQDWSDAAGPMENPTEALGFKWLEFVHPEDLEAAEAWIRAGDGAELHCRCHCGTAANVWLEVAMTKRRAGRYWVAVGDNRKL